MIFSLVREKIGREEDGEVEDLSLGPTIGKFGEAVGDTR